VLSIGWLEFSRDKGKAARKGRPKFHGAHGFLLQNFFSPANNQRDGEWGGSMENRMRFPITIVNEING
jgi:hypothetical protein